VLVQAPSHAAAVAREAVRRSGRGVTGFSGPWDQVIAARRALGRNGAIVIVRGLEEGVHAVNELAPEHAEVIARGAADLAPRIVAGAVFVGAWAPVAVGDYGIGPNHVLPTGGAARRSSPLSVRDFQRRQSVVRMTQAGLRRVASGMARVAAAEGFRAHAQSLLMRLNG